MRRWLLWTFLCRRGRRCADVVLEEMGMTNEVGDPIDFLGAVGVIQYTCGNCGTSYTRSVILGNDGAFTQADRVRS